MSETKAKPCTQSTSLLTPGPARITSSPIAILNLGGYPLNFYVKRNVRVFLKVSPNGGRDASGDDCINSQPVQRTWDEPNVVQSTVLLRPFVLFTMFEHHVISRDETTPPAQNPGFNLATRGGQGSHVSQRRPAKSSDENQKRQLPLCGLYLYGWTSAAVLSYIFLTRKIMPRAPTCILCSYESEPRGHKLKRSARRSQGDVTML